MCTGMYVHPVLCRSLPMYRYLLPTYCGKYRGAFSGSPRDNLRFFLGFNSACRKRLISHTRSRSFTLSAIPIAPKIAPSLIEEKLALLCRGLIILRNVLGPRARKRETRGRRLQNFIVCHAEINNKTDLIFYDLYNIFLKARRYLSCRAQVYAYVYVYVCMSYAYFYQVYIKSRVCVYVYTRLYAIRVLHLLLLFYICILGSFTRAFSRPTSISLPYIQYVKIYRLDVI